MPRRAGASRDEGAVTVDAPFRVIKLQFGSTKVRYRGLSKNAAQVYDSVRIVELVDHTQASTGVCDRCPNGQGGSLA